MFVTGDIIKGNDSWHYGITNCYAHMVVLETQGEWMNVFVVYHEQNIDRMFSIYNVKNSEEIFHKVDNIEGVIYNNDTIMKIIRKIINKPYSQAKVEAFRDKYCLSGFTGNNMSTFHYLDDKFKLQRVEIYKETFGKNVTIIKRKSLVLYLEIINIYNLKDILALQLLIFYRYEKKMSVIL